MTQWQVAEVQRRLAQDDRLRCAVCGHVADLHHFGTPIACAICPDEVCQLPIESP